MCVSYFNQERYPDPTPQEALQSIDQEQKVARTFRPIVYICSPFAGDVETNVLNARRYCRFAVTRGVIPIAVHLLYPQFMNDKDPKERELAIFFGNAILSKCQEVWVFGEKLSEGMKEEIKRAKWKHYRIRFFDSELKEVGEYA